MTLMLVGIALFGLLAGSLFASFFVEGREEQKVDPKLEEIEQRLERIETMLRVATGDRPDRPRPNHRASVTGTLVELDTLAPKSPGLE